VELAAQPYVGIARSITMQTFSEIADRLPEVFAWLASCGVEPVDAPFFKYNVIDMERELEMEAGVPVAATPPVQGEIFAGVLPAGRYATVTHTGHPDELMEVTRQLLEWAAGEGLEFDKTDLPQGQRWTCRLERLLTNPAEEPDMHKWQTQLLFKLADQRR
jgi:effector-binding domain-containing protein